MKKFYLFAFSLLTSAAMLAQAPVNARKAPLQRLSGVGTVSPRVEAHPHSGMRVVLLEEDFQGATGAPSDIPSGWSTSEVLQTQGTADGTDDDTGPAFRSHNSESANAGSYWPVPEVGVGNYFAGANDDAVPCDCDMAEVYIETPSVNFSDASNPAITFDAYHDGNFVPNGGSTAWLSISTDGGSTWNMVNYPLSDDGLIPQDEGNWQTLVITLFDYAGVADVRFRFYWADGGQWASGFAIDNVEIGDLEDYSLTLNKVISGDWNQAAFGQGYWDYSQIPSTQTSVVKATGVMSNTGLNDLAGVTLGLEVTLNGNSMGSWLSTDVNDALPSLGKDTISVVTDYIPTELGTYTVTGTALTTSSENDSEDNVATTSFQVTECTYARDAGAAQAFFALDNSGDFAGNLFDIYAEETFSSIHVALGAGSTEFATISGVIYEFLGFDDTSGDPLFVYVDNSSTEEATIYSADLNAVNEANFICLPFSSPVTLEAGKVYLVAVTATDAIRLPVSGSNVWPAPASWLYTDADQTYGWAQGIFMIRLIGECALGCTVGVDENTSNEVSLSNMPNPASISTLINFELEASANVSLTVRDVTGKLMEEIFIGNKPAGAHNYELNVEKYAPGVYTYTLNNGAVSTTARMIVE